MRQRNKIKKQNYSLRVIFLNNRPKEYDLSSDAPYNIYIKKEENILRINAGKSTYNTIQEISLRLGGYCTDIYKEETNSISKDGTKSKKGTAQRIDVYNIKHNCLIKKINIDDPKITRNSLEIKYKRIISAKYKLEAKYNDNDIIISITELIGKNKDLSDNEDRIYNVEWKNKGQQEEKINTNPSLPLFEFNLNISEFSNINRYYFYGIEISNGKYTYTKIGITKYKDIGTRYKNESLTQEAIQDNYSANLKYQFEGDILDIQNFENLLKYFAKEYCLLKKNKIDLLTKTNGDTEMIIGKSNLFFDKMELKENMEKFKIIYDIDNIFGKIIINDTIANSVKKQLNQEEDLAADF
jgi:hypothetical protein